MAYCRSWYPRRKKHRPSTSQYAPASLTPPPYQAQQPTTAADRKTRGGSIAETRHSVNITLLPAPPDIAVTAGGHAPASPWLVTQQAARLGQPSSIPLAASRARCCVTDMRMSDGL